MERRGKSSKRTLHNQKTYKYKGFKSYQKDKQNIYTNQQEVKNQLRSSLSKNIEDSATDLKSKYIKTIVSLNEGYFRQKLKIKQNGKPNDLRLIIPTRNTTTVYKQDYNCKNKSTGNLRLKKNLFVSPKAKLGFNSTTIYQQQYIKRRTTEKPIIKNIYKLSIDQNAPTFMDTQYSNTFLNWGADSKMDSMKPKPEAAVTNIPFQSVSAYQKDYGYKLKRNVTSARPILMRATQSNFFNNKNKMQLSYMTTSRAEFCEKSQAKQSNCKPKTPTLGMDKNGFQGKTEYRSQFIRTRKQSQKKLREDMPLSDLQNLVLNA